MKRDDVYRNKDGYYDPTAGAAIVLADRRVGYKKDCGSMLKRIVPLESEEQQALFTWARLNENLYPDLARLVAIPNGGLRNKPEAVRFKKEGVRAGFPDMILPTSRRGYHALAIELKRQKGAPSKVLTEQYSWLDYLLQQGWFACVCYGADEAIEKLKWYLDCAA